MAQISIIKKSDISEARRFDAEYFKPEYLEIEKQVLQTAHKPIGEIITLLTDYHANGSYQILNENVKLLDKNDYALMVRTVDFETDNFETDSKFLSESSYNFLKKTKMFGGEIVINKIGNAGRVYFLPNLNRPVSLGMNQFMLKVNNEINNYYLYIYLISIYGKKLLERRITGAVPLSIDKQSVRNVLVSVPSKHFQLQIENIVKEAQQKQTQSKQLYQETEQLLLEELGLISYKPKHHLSFETTKKEVQESTRIDAEYFQPKYAEIIENIENYVGGFDVVSNQFEQNKTLSKKDKEFYNYIEISDVNVSNGEILVNKIELKDIPANGKRKLFKNDLLISKVRPYRGAISFIDFEKNNLLGSGAFTVLQEKTEYKKEVLMIFLKTIFIKELLLRYNCGTSYPVIKDEDILNLKIPLIKPQIQKQIAEKITESHKLRKESKELFEEAKRKVEREIEKQ